MPGTRFPPSGPTCRSLLDWRGSASIATLTSDRIGRRRSRFDDAHHAGGGGRSQADLFTITAGPSSVHLKTAILEIA